MGKLVVSEFVTLDGVFEDPGGGEDVDYGGWAFQFDRGAAGDQFKLDELMETDALLMGRITYDGFSEAWPKMDDNEFGKKMNSMPKYVVSSTLENPEWTNTTVITGDLSDRVGDLKRQISGDILVNGSGQLVSALAGAGLVDECRLMVFPIALGRGKRLFAGASASLPFRATETRQAGETLIVIYVPR